MLLNLKSTYLRWCFRASARVDFYHQVSLLLDNGVSLENTLREIRRVNSQHDRPGVGARRASLRSPLVQILDKTIHGVKSGNGFAEAIAEWCSPQETSVIAAGEASGELTEAFKRVALVMKQRATLKKRLAGELAMPIMAILAIMIAYIVMGYQLVPILVKLMPVERWTGDTARLLKLSLFFKTYSWLIAVVLGALLVGFAQLLPRWTGPMRDRFERYPPFSIYRLFVGSTFLLNMSAKLAQGISQEDALKSEKAFAAPYLLERVNHTLRGIRSGMTFGDALMAAEHEFPDRRTIGTLRVISGRRGFDKALESFTNQWFESNLEAMTKAASWLRIVAILFVGYGVLCMANGVYGIQDNVQSALNNHF